jgi:hypothetical protein
MAHLGSMLNDATVFPVSLDEETSTFTLRATKSDFCSTISVYVEHSTSLRVRAFSVHGVLMHETLVSGDEATCRIVADFVVQQCALLIGADLSRAAGA